MTAHNALAEIITALCKIDNPTVMKEFISELFTPAEVTDVALRWRLMQMLHDGVPQRKISSDLGISLCKITRGSRIVKNKNSVMRSLLDKEHTSAGK